MTLLALKDVVRIDGGLVTAKKNDNPHQRTRRDHATETAEDYVEAIAEILSESGVCRANDLARRFTESWLACRTRDCWTLSRISQFN